MATDLVAEASDIPAVLDEGGGAMVCHRLGTRALAEEWFAACG